MGLSLSDRQERSRSVVRWACWRAILSGLLQFLRELHFIEASSTAAACSSRACCSSFGNCTSLRRRTNGYQCRQRTRCSSFGNCTSLRPAQACGGDDEPEPLQFLRELHFIEARSSSTLRWAASSCSSFGSCISLRLGRKGYRRGRDAGCSSFGDCTSLRRVADRLPLAALLVAVLSGTALH